MTELDRTSLDRLLPFTPGPADWDDVLSRSGARQRASPAPRRVRCGGARRLVATASAFGSVRDFVLAQWLHRPASQ